MDPIDVGIAAVMVLSVGGGMWILGTIVRAWVKRWGKPAGAIEAGEARELRDAMTRLAGEVDELHERVDFAERMLSAQRGAQHIGDGS